MNQPMYRRGPGGQGAIPDVIFALLIANGIAYALFQFQPNLIWQYFALQPLVSPSGYQFPSFMPWQLVTYGFLHSTQNLMHILFNMVMLWMFGRDLERLMGPRRFLTYYLVCVIGAGIVQLLVGVLQGGGGSTVGASGGVFGILLAYGMAFPNRTIMLIFPPIPMKAKYFVILIGLFELYIGASGTQQGIANFAHLGGMLFGFLLLKRWSMRRR